ncbi:dTMP kinase [Suttonella ornithocola]|uniref:Thymidylate kinase n=1 Tax=Suttonella ornithocola TaxID=279832 RepID=A0A380N0Z3_9GAMM|nr:dTMP kinase [Suttonella ornithocola]SUO97956.1 Thymidylate kinase [Suttonella ornithocola]
MTGKFITLDGTEGAGKTTQLRYIKHYLHQKNKTVYLTREPGGTAVGEKIRNIFLNPNLVPTAETELLLIFAARKQHLEQEIWPRLQEGEWVISDRFNDATYAYQGYGRGIDLTRIRSLEKWIQGDFQPHLSLILTVSEQIAKTRLNQREQEKDRMENENQKFFQRVASGYYQRAENETHVHLIEANKEPQTVFQQIQSYLDTLLDS